MQYYIIFNFHFYFNWCNINSIVILLFNNLSNYIIIINLNLIVLIDNLINKSILYILIFWITK